MARLFHYRFCGFMDPDIFIRGFPHRRSCLCAGIFILPDSEHSGELFSVDSKRAHEGNEKEAQDNSFSAVHMLNNSDNNNSDCDRGSRVGDNMRDRDDNNVLLVHDKLHPVRDENTKEGMWSLL